MEVPSVGRRPPFGRHRWPAKQHARRRRGCVLGGVQLAAFPDQRRPGRDGSDRGNGHSGPRRGARKLTDQAYADFRSGFGRTASWAADADLCIIDALDAEEDLDVNVWVVRDDVGRLTAALPRRPASRECSALTRSSAACPFAIASATDVAASLTARPRRTWARARPTPPLRTRWAGPYCRTAAPAVALEMEDGNSWPT